MTPFAWERGCGGRHFPLKIPRKVSELFSKKGNLSSRVDRVSLGVEIDYKHNG